MKGDRSKYVVECCLHGRVEIEEEVLVDLLESPAVKRLEGIHQHGVSTVDPTLYIPGIPPVNRLEHSIGAMLLVRKVGGSLEAQASALLHDCAHTVFSHVTDTAFGYVVHEVDKHEYIAQTDITLILRNHGLDPERVLNEELFPLVELPSPAICADRLDYGLRDSRAFGFLTDQDVEEILKGLTQRDGRMVLNDEKIAKKLAQAYKSSDERCWSADLHYWIYAKAAEMIKLAMSYNLISKSHLWKESDQEFWRRLIEASETEKFKDLKKAIKLVHPRWKLEKAKDADFLITPKVRVLDPDVLIVGSQGDEIVKKLSDIDPTWKVALNLYKEEKGKNRRWKVQELDETSP